MFHASIAGRGSGPRSILTGLGGVLYVLAVTHPTPLALRLLLLAGLALFGWLFYVRLPKMPTEITVSDDGWVSFQSPRGATRVQAADIRSIGRSFGRRTLRVQHAGGQVQLAQPIQKASRLPLHHEGPESGDRDSWFLSRSHLALWQRHRSTPSACPCKVAPIVGVASDVENCRTFD